MPQTSMDTAISTIPPSSSNIDDSREGLMSRLVQREEKADTALQGIAKKVDEAKLPEPPKLTPAPKGEDYNRSPMEAFGSAAMVLAGFGSLLTKHPMQAALNSAAGVMNARNQQDAKAFSQAMDKWKLDTENAWKMANWQQELYKDFLTKEEGEARIIAMSMKDTTAAAAIESKTMRDLYKMQSSATDKLTKTIQQQREMDRRTAKYKEDGMSEFDAQTKAYNEVIGSSIATLDEKEKIKDENEAKPMADISKLKDTDKYPGTGLSVASVKQKAEQYNYDPSVITRGGLSKQDKEAIINENSRLQKEQGQTAGDIEASQASYKADTHSLMQIQKMTDAALSYEETAKKNFDTALKLAKTGIPTDASPWLNKWEQKGEVVLGDPNIPPYAAALVTAANEYAKVMSGSTGAQAATDSSRQEAADLFSKAYSYETIQNVIKVATTDMDNRKQSLNGKIDEIKNRIRTGGAGSVSTDIPTAPTNLPDGKKQYNAKLKQWRVNGKIYDAQGNPI